MELQELNPLSSEGAICGKLRVGREYIAERAKRSPAVKEAREVMAAIRQNAWEELGIKIITMPAQLSNATQFIWQSRNILGWRNDPSHDAAASEKPVRTLAYRLDDTPHKKDGKP
jgi:hypothetical protein